MSVVIQEGHLHFEFDSTWDHVEKWDESPAYRNGIHGLDDARALDIVAFSSTHNECLLLEIKDFRAKNDAAAKATKASSRKQSEPDTTEAQAADALTKQVAQKVAGTLAGLVGTARMCDYSFAAPVTHALVAHRSDGIKVRVVLWVEGEPLSKQASPRSKVNLETLTNSLKRKVAWLTQRPVQVLSTASPPVIPGLSVTDLRP